MLIALLVCEIKRCYVARSRNAVIANIVYDAGAYVFESLLEYRCKAGGNGHHVAQDLARKIYQSISPLL